MAAGPTPGARSAFNIPSLDGIRCVAVLVVFIGHGATLAGPWPGHVGVTVFFFLSGFLITTLLRREYDRTGKISLGKFYLRRALRILPPAYISITLSVVVGLTGILSSSMSKWGTLSEVLQYTNYYMVWAHATTGDAHAGLPPESSMLWSLAVEEHFYLVFPAVLITLLWRKLSWRTIGWILVGACVLAPLWRLYLDGTGANFYRLYISTDTRFDGLLAGAALALLANPALRERAPFGIPDRWLRYVLSPIAFVVFVAVAMAPDDDFRLTVGDTILYMCLVPLFWLVIAHPDGATGRLLNSRFVMHIGVLSFSIYLLHRLIISLVRLVIDVAPLVDIVSLVVVIGLAQVVYVGVEKPLASVRRKLEARIPHARNDVRSAAG